MKQANGSSKNEAVATSKKIKDENENPYKMEPYGQTDIMRHRNIWGKYTQSHLTSKEGEKDVAMERAWCGEVSVFVTFSAWSGNICR